MVAEETAPRRWLPMEATELGPGLVERLEQLATCPLCGGPFEDPVLLACEHSFCRACLARRWGTPPKTGTEASPTVCPCCGLPCPRRSLRSNVRLAVEVRISRGLREKLAEPGARTGRRRGGRIPTMGSLDQLGEVRLGVLQGSAPGGLGRFMGSLEKREVVPPKPGPLWQLGQRMELRREEQSKWGGWQAAAVGVEEQGLTPSAQSEVKSAEEDGGKELTLCLEGWSWTDA